MATMRKSEIYSLYSPLQKRLLLVAGACIAILTPFSDTIYLPALDDIQSDFHTSTTTVSLTVSLYLAFVGLGQLFAGILSDKFGRLPVVLSCLILFEALSIACIFAQSVLILIVERCIQGFLVGPAISLVQTIIADVFAPNVRGSAMAAFLAPMLFGPVIAPLIGGFLTLAYGWRLLSIFIQFLIDVIFLNSLLL